MADLGIDVSCVDDVDPAFALVSGRTALAQALARRLITPRGTLWNHPDYGFDLRGFLLDDVSEFELQTGVVAEMLKDERVYSAACRISVSDNRYTLDIEIDDDEGPFSFVLAIGDVSAELLSVDYQ